MIALQQVIPRRGSVENQVAWLARKLDYDDSFVAADPVDAPKRYGNTLLSRRKVLARHQRLLQPLDDDRVAAPLQVDVDGQPVNVYVTHLNERADARGTVTRRRQVANLPDFISSNSDQAPLVIASDFNTAADALDLEALRRGYGDSYGSVHRNSDATVSTLNLHVFDKPARIDHVFFQQNRLLAREARILFDAPYCRRPLGLGPRRRVGALAARPKRTCRPVASRTLEISTAPAIGYIVGAPPGAMEL